MTPPPSLQALIDSVRQDAGTDDPVSQLAVAAATAAQLEETTDALLGHFVDRCRHDGRDTQGPGPSEFDFLHFIFIEATLAFQLFKEPFMHQPA